MPKQAHLAAQGVYRVMDSRSLAFADEIAAETGGAGVDVVLNSLTGGAITRSLDVTAPNRRFAHIGQLDPSTQEQLAEVGQIEAALEIVRSNSSATSDATEETERSVNQLGERASELETLIAHFKT